MIVFKREEERRERESRRKEGWRGSRGAWHGGVIASPLPLLAQALYI